MRPSWRTRKRKLRTTAGKRPSGLAWALALVTVALLCVGPAGAQEKPKKGQPQTRTLTGVVTSPDGKPVARASVLLENTKTKQIVSFYSQQDGTYFFHELSPDVDYKVTARLENDSSATHTLSSFDSRREAVINLKLEMKKQ
jgi:hypothetical protein